MQSSNTVSVEMVQKCAELLQITFKSRNDTERKAAEEALNKLSENGDQFIQTLIALITSHESSADIDHIKESAGTYLSLMIKTQSFGDIMSNEQKFHKAGLLLHAMIQEHLKLSYRINLADEIKNILFPKVLEAMKLNNKGMVGGLIALQCMTNTTVQGQLSKLVALYSESIGSLIDVGNIIVDAVLNDLTALGLMDGSTSQAEVALVKVIDQLEALRVWTETIKNFISKMQEKKPVLLENVISKENLVLIFTKTLCIFLNTKSQIQNCFISTSGYQNLDNLMNETKIKVMRCFNIIVDFIFESKGQINITTSKFYGLLPTILPLMITTLITFCKSSQIDLNEALNNATYETLLTEVLILVTLLGKHTEFYFIFAEHKKTLIADVIMSLMRTGIQEIDMVEQNPGEFVQLALDTCDQQLSETVKTQTAQLLETLCDHVDGSLTFVAILTFTMLDFSLNSNDFNDIQSKFPPLTECKDSLILTNTDPKIRVETCLMILSAISYILPRRNDLLEFLEKLIVGYKDYFLNTDDVLIRSRYCLLISYYCDNIFKDSKSKEIFYLQIKYLVESVGLQDEAYRIVALQACDGLKSIFEDDVMIPKIAPIITEILEKFVEYVSFVRIPEFFEILQEISKAYASQIVQTPNVLLVLVKILCQKIQDEVSKQNKSSHQGNIIMKKCWNVIRTIGEQKNYKPLYGHIEEGLIPLYNYMQNPDKISFDDDILLFINSLIRQSGEVSQLQWALVTTFMKIFQKNKNMFNNLFTTMNLIIVNGRNIILNQPSITDMFIDMSCLAMFCDYKKANEANQAEGAVMLQLIMQYLGEKLTLMQWEKIIYIVLEKINKDIRKTFLKARLLGVILHGFMVNYPVTEKLLQSKDMVSKMISVILYNMRMFIHPYDKKVFVIGISSIFIQPNISQYVSSQITELFGAVVTMLKIIQAIEQAEIMRKKRNAKKEGSNELEEIPTNEEIINSYLENFQKADEAMQNAGNRYGNSEIDHESHKPNYGGGDNDDDDGDYDSDDVDDGDYDENEMDYLHENEETEAHATLDLLISDFKKRDEFSFFKSIVMKIRDLNEAGLKAIIQSMSQSKQDYLRQVLLSHRVIIDAAENKTVVRKIVFARAKKQMKK